MSFNFDSKAGVNEYVFGHNVSERDDEGRRLPKGGYAQSGVFNTENGRIPGLMIRWHDGPVDRRSGERTNGTFVEDVLEVCRLRLKFYQESAFACDENAEAMEAVEAALDALARRRGDRKARGVEGKNEE